MSAEEAELWKLFFLVNGPFDQERADWHVAGIIQAILMASGAKKDEETPFTLKDCLMELGTPLTESDDTDETKNLRLANELQALAWRYR
jgi:hypothetical protein